MAFIIDWLVGILIAGLIDRGGITIADTLLPDGDETIRLMLSGSIFPVSTVYNVAPRE